MTQKLTNFDLNLPGVIFSAPQKFEVKRIISQKDYHPHEFVTLLKLDPFIKLQFERDSGVFEGYTLEEHVIMALRQFEKYFAHSPLPSQISLPFFRFFLAMHDIGKPIAVILGDKKRQHEFTVQILPRVFQAYDFEKNEIDLALALVDGDAIGAFLRDKITLNDAAAHIHKNAAKTTLKSADFLEILSLYYKCDAGSYTQDAGGIKSLDYLFDFDHAHWQLNLEPKLQEKFKHLETALAI